MILYAFIGIVVQQRDMAASLWAAATGALAIAVMIVATWGRRAGRMAMASQG